MNRICVAGTVYTTPVFSHKNNGECFYEVKLTSERNSGVCDVIPLLVSETLVNEFDTGSKIEVFGELRTFKRKRVEGERWLPSLVMQVFVLSVSEYTKEKNEVIIFGTILKQPVLRNTPKGKDICELLIESKREKNDKTDYIHCICWGRNSLRANNMEVGTEIKVEGRFQSREYEKKVYNHTENRTAYEVSINTIQKGE